MNLRKTLLEESCFSVLNISCIFVCLFVSYISTQKKIIKPKPCNRAIYISSTVDSVLPYV